MFYKIFSVICISVFFSACASNTTVSTRGADFVVDGVAVGHDSNAQFRILPFSIEWKDNPEFEVRLYRTVPKTLNAIAAFSAEASGTWKAGLPIPASDEIPEKSRELGDTYYKNMRIAYREHVGEQLTNALAKRGVNPGGGMRIVITPIYGQQSIDGWGSNMLLRTTFISVGNQSPVVVDVLYESGIHWTGVHNAAKPNEKDVAQFVNKLVEFLSDKKAI